MMKIDMTGKTVEDAVNNALKELNVTRDNVEVTILDEGSKGLLFNLIGARPAKVQVSVKKDYICEAKAFLKDILESMGIKVEIRIEDKNDTLNIYLTGSEMGILIGYRGETLDSLQYLTSLVVNKDHQSKYKRVVLDTENYRKKREETLKRLALKVANKVKNTGRITKLEPMNPYERRIIHSVLQGNADIKTYSEGEEPYRRVVIDLKKA